jgi:hypothetical protein
VCWTWLIEENNMKRWIYCAVLTLAATGSTAWAQAQPDANTAKTF